jgi:hypothetical protein
MNLLLIPRPLWLSALLALVALTSCENPEYWSFQEEVVLNTGEHVSLNRKLRRNSVWPHISSDGYRAVVDDWLTERTHHIQWQSSKQGGSHPILIGIVSDSLYVATNGSKGLQYCIDNPTAYNVLLYRQTFEGWEETKQTAELLDGLTQNMLLTLDWGEPSKPKQEVISLAGRQERDNNASSQVRSLRGYLENTYGAKCETTLRLAGYLPLVGTSAPPSASSPAASN